MTQYFYIDESGDAGLHGQASSSSHFVIVMVSYPERVQRRYADWFAAQQTEGLAFTSEQRWWLDQVATHIGVNLEIHADDFNYGEFFNRSGQVAALRPCGGCRILWVVYCGVQGIGHIASWSQAHKAGRWREFTYEELLARDKVNLDIFWLRGESLEDSANLPYPDVLVTEIVEDLRSARVQFESIAEELGEE